MRGRWAWPTTQLATGGTRSHNPPRVTLYPLLHQTRDRAMRDDLEGMTAAALVQLHDSLCAPHQRICRPWKKGKAALIERVRPLLEAQELSERSGQTEARAAATEEADDRPETVGRLVERLLLADEGSLSYADVVEEVRRRFPDAKTTRRSVASVAADMRKRGVEVPKRR